MKSSNRGPMLAGVAWCLFSWLLVMATAGTSAAHEGNQAPSVANVAATEAGRTVVLYNVTVVSPERDAPLAHAWVTIRDGRITAVGSGAEPAKASSADGDMLNGNTLDGESAAPIRIDGEGRFLTPGLIDSHVHLASIPGLPMPPPPSLRSLVTAYETQLPRSYLFHGFTTVIDLNVVDRDALSRFEAAPHHPDLFHCDGALALADGYPMVFLSPMVRYALYGNFLIDPEGAPAPAGFSAAEHAPATAVARVAAGGGICTKSFWEDGFGDAKIWPTPGAAVLRNVVTASHDQGLTATVHANAFEAWGAALDAGFDVVVHGLWNWDGQQAATGLPPALSARLDQAIDAGVAVMPTAQVIAGLRALFDPGFLDTSALRVVLPAPLIDWYRSSDGRWFAESLRADDFGGAPDARIRSIFDDVLDRGARVTTHLAHNGGTILLGSDTPSGPTYGNPPGLNGFLELQRLASAGVSLPQIFDAATRANARAFKLDDRYGTIEPGKVAHLLLLDANPLESVEAWNAIHAVVLHGELIPRASLSAEE